MASLGDGSRSVGAVVGGVSRCFLCILRAFVSSWLAFQNEPRRHEGDTKKSSRLRHAPVVGSSANQTHRDSPIAAPDHGDPNDCGDRSDSTWLLVPVGRPSASHPAADERSRGGEAHAGRPTNDKVHFSLRRSVHERPGRYS